MEREIPRTEWDRFLNEFSRRHQGWLATLEVSGRELGDQVGTKSLPFRGVSYDSKDSGGDSISIFLGQSPETDETRRVTAPTHIAFQQDRQGRDQALAVEASDGTLTVLHFANPSYPEAVDGI